MEDEGENIRVLKDNWHYFGLFAITIITFAFFNEDKVILPSWGTGFLLLTMFVVALGESVKAWARSGAVVTTSLGVGRGSCEGININDDIKMATKKDHPSFACIALGGFVVTGVAARGRKAFVVCPPEHVVQNGQNFDVKTTLQHIKFKSLPDYVQESLRQLPHFSTQLIDKKHNLYFGMTSPFDGTDTLENVNFEKKFKANFTAENTYKQLFDEVTDTKKKLEPEKPRLFQLMEGAED